MVSFSKKRNLQFGLLPHALFWKPNGRKILYNIFNKNEYEIWNQYGWKENSPIDDNEADKSFVRVATWADSILWSSVLFLLPEWILNRSALLLFFLTLSKSMLSLSCSKSFSHIETLGESLISEFKCRFSRHLMKMSNWESSITLENWPIKTEIYNSFIFSGRCLASIRTSFSYHNNC